MSVKNFYPQLPVIEYKKTTVEMPLVVSFAKLLVGKYAKEVVRMAYCIFRNESANGKAGVNNNYIGLQADNAVWTGLNLDNAIGTCVRVDGAGDTRRFICFNENGYKDCIDFLCFKINQRGMFIGAVGVTNADELYNIYQMKWVANPKENTPEARKDFNSLYRSSLTAIV
jgi:hypothetical protein